MAVKVILTDDQAGELFLQYRRDENSDIWFSNFKAWSQEHIGQVLRSERVGDDLGSYRWFAVFTTYEEAIEWKLKFL